MHLYFKKIITSIFIFLLLSAVRPFTVFSAENIQQNINPSLGIQVLPLDQLNSLKNEVQELRNESYQAVLNNYQIVADKLNYYINSLTLIAGIFGVIIAMFTAFVGINFYFTKKEFAEKLKEINNYVVLAKQNASSVKKLTDETKRQTKIIPTILKDFEKNRNEMIQLLARIKKTKTKKVKEFDDALTRIQETESKLSHKLLNTVSNIQSMSSRASIISGSATSQPNINSPYGGITPAGYISYSGSMFANKKCSNCGKQINLLDEPSDYGSGSLRVGPPLCSDCKGKCLV
ncbi:hypothetical protein KKA69_01225 [Patescibacteria group bacterium]|nr:hypothetical protein [Patescibacteria group bacterium]